MQLQWMGLSDFKKDVKHHKSIFLFFLFIEQIDSVHKTSLNDSVVNLTDGF